MPNKQVIIYFKHNYCSREAKKPSTVAQGDRDRYEVIYDDVTFLLSECGVKSELLIITPCVLYA